MGSEKLEQIGSILTAREANGQGARVVGLFLAQIFFKLAACYVQFGLV